MDAYAIDADPATGTAYRASPVHGTVASGGGVTFDHVVFGFSSHCNYGPCYEPMAPRLDL